MWVMVSRGLDASTAYAQAKREIARKVVTEKFAMVGYPVD